MTLPPAFVMSCVVVLLALVSVVTLTLLWVRVREIRNGEAFISVFRPALTELTGLAVRGYRDLIFPEKQHLPAGTN